MTYPVLIAEDMPDIGADAYAIAFGNFEKGYTIAERPDLRVLRDPYSANPRSQPSGKRSTAASRLTQASPSRVSQTAWPE